MTLFLKCHGASCSCSFVGTLEYQRLLFLLAGLPVWKLFRSCSCHSFQIFYSKLIFSGRPCSKALSRILPPLIPSPQYLPLAHFLCMYLLALLALEPHLNVTSTRAELFVYFCFFLFTRSVPGTRSVLSIFLWDFLYLPNYFKYSTDSQPFGKVGITKMWRMASVETAEMFLLFIVVMSGASLRP